MSIKEYFTFTRRERTGIIALVVLLLAVSVVPHFIPASRPVAEHLPIEKLQILPPRDSSGFNTGNDRQSNYDYQHRDRFYYENQRGNRRYPEKPWYNNNYRNRYPRDSAYRQRPADGYYKNNYGEGKSFSHGDERRIFRNYASDYAAWHRSRNAVVDINAADTTAFISLPGIGSKLATRIVSFREKLGGFHSVEQIREVYGLRDSVFTMLLPYLKCDSAYARKPMLTYNGAK